MNFPHQKCSDFSITRLSSDWKTKVKSDAEKLKSKEFVLQQQSISELNNKFVCLFVSRPNIRFCGLIKVRWFVIRFKITHNVLAVLGLCSEILMILFNFQIFIIYFQRSLFAKRITKCLFRSRQFITEEHFKLQVCMRITLHKLNRSLLLWLHGIQINMSNMQQSVS